MNPTSRKRRRKPRQRERRCKLCRKFRERHAEACVVCAPIVNAAMALLPPATREARMGVTVSRFDPEDEKHLLRCLRRHRAAFDAAVRLGASKDALREILGLDA